MSRGFWEEEGKPEMDSAGVRYAAETISKVYEYSTVGGNLQSAIHDWNVCDGNLEWCQTAIAKNVHEADEEQLAAETECLKILRGISYEARVSALALHKGFWS